MEIKLVVVGKTKNKELISLIEDYIKRINFFNKFQIIEVNSVKTRKNNSDEIKKIECENILKKIKKNDLLFLLDEKGKNYNSREFADFLKVRFQESKTIVFVIGGAFGFSKDLYTKSKGLISLSKMTFSHQIIRLFFTEQLYRAFTILNNHPYHND
ncbi:23S rRNA (pseudouridine(1915)-N(3))-methyltransferase RlmH [Flavobacteriaceae bacterium]|jgi:23S rRNA (pseudouridine1915-N3)-methyltransferase|nr:23S rRNA (pseudouridine(1915)-N(3))-methyltransferase RlmH [Flavobacteriaceae bacterium]MBT4231274.1 23S rRNA (pseudouridine(1915)-N(3))-methyltransferase RlmH [Flavobacteriaceae bacterium]MBT5392774.1 23S rRNA (pseudouridine(1915)-N(3))-methyltransferase RlmH [Flavobacteriaceae bacterium]MBT7575273.1 23S rRNA (pseudouridine(1915)-N(3))-methyltransferase RlmH [Flavobacteriaceae bacterium]MDA7731536.1 23S rRNA (pseudouridine(1915)-N(3))-methyltransferase RlmH [Flavobacteriaceae bacterium]